MEFYWTELDRCPWTSSINFLSQRSMYQDSHRQINKISLMECLKVNSKSVMFTNQLKSDVIYRRKFTILVLKIMWEEVNGLLWFCKDGATKENPHMLGIGGWIFNIINGFIKPYMVWNYLVALYLETSSIRYVNEMLCTPRNSLFWHDYPNCAFTWLYVRCRLGIKTPEGDNTCLGTQDLIFIEKL